MQKNMQKFVFYLLIGLIFSFELNCKESEEPSCKIGNFALSASQQPGPFISFGENIIDRNEIQLFLFGNDLIGKEKHFIDAVPGILYGITDDFSVFFNVPIAVSYKDGHHSSGFGDMFLQFEYAVYSDTHSCSSDQVTIVANASF